MGFTSCAPAYLDPGASCRRGQAYVPRAPASDRVVSHGGLRAPHRRIAGRPSGPLCPAARPAPSQRPAESPPRALRSCPGCASGRLLVGWDHAEPRLDPEPRRIPRGRCPALPCPGPRRGPVVLRGVVRQARQCRPRHPTGGHPRDVPLRGRLDRRGVRPGARRHHGHHRLPPLPPGGLPGRPAARSTCVSGPTGSAPRASWWTCRGCRPRCGSVPAAVAGDRPGARRHGLVRVGADDGVLPRCREPGPRPGRLGRHRRRARGPRRGVAATWRRTGARPSPRPTSGCSPTTSRSPVSAWWPRLP